MTSKIKVNILADGGDNSIITSDGAGSFTASSSLASSVQSVGGLQNTPAFEAYLSGSDQSLSSGVLTTIAFNSEYYDSDSKYDTSTYRFTPGIAGKYFLYAGLRVTDANQYLFQLEIRTSTENSIARCATQNEDSDTAFISTTAILGASDYAYVTCYQGSGSTRNANSGQTETFFGGYKIIGA